MTDILLLQTAIINSGLKKKFIAEKLGITAYGLQKKIEGKSEFKASEIKKLCNLLNINVHDKELIFFAD